MSQLTRWGERQQDLHDGQDLQDKRAYVNERLFIVLNLANLENPASDAALPDFR